MQAPPETNDLLALRSMPKAAAALRQRSKRIIDRWTAEVERHLPHANPLTAKEVRDSIPSVLEKIALALESATGAAVEVLTEVGTAHGVARFQQRYDIEEIIIEYRLLRRIIFDELSDAVGTQLEFIDAVPLDMGVDTALHRGVMSYVRHLVEQLQASAAAESKFLAFLSHDLRNQLNSVMLTLQMLELRLESEPKFAEEVQDVRSLRTSMLNTVEGMERLLQAERLRRQNVALKLAPVDLHRLANELIAQVARHAQGKGLQVENGVPATAAAYSDRELVSLALQNLLGNAVKFSASGIIRIEARETPEGWRVVVADQGPGIEAQRLGALFDAFTRGETHGQPGIGLGLNIASHAARLLGSELTVESAVGRGSTFSFVVPAARPEQAL